ncbi:polyketide synthase dehydratase domain-containing protein, partial [Hamadaea sp. NPDC051192]|uniref:polyketide synthase dehydratase domain-containing protein n=1 Tax=Hamadaea sp. NPDC051192 TaxID=3154940 RepID=UPI0034185218
LLPPLADGHVLELRDVTFLRPVRVDGASIRYSVRVDADGEFSVHDGGPGAAVTGSARWVPAVAAAFDAGAADRCPTEEAVAHSHSGVVEFGPRWAALAEHRVGSNEELALLRAPESALADLRRWTLHPALLDVATAYGRHRGQGSYLPLGYGRVVAYAPLPAEFRSHLRHRVDGSGGEVIAADLTLADLDGRVLVEIEDFVLRRVDPAALTTPPAGTNTGTGTATNATVAAPATPKNDGAISPAEGADAFRRALAAGATQLVIHPRTVEDLLEHQIVVADEETPATAAVDASGSMTDLEAAIAAVWRHVLGVEVIDVDDDFFALGGNSLVAVQLIAQTRTATGVRVPMRSLFDAPTVAGQAAVAAKLRSAAAEAPTATATATGQTAEPVSKTTIPRLAR